MVEITSYGSKNRNPEGKIVENLGSCRAPGTDILAIVKSFGIPSEFPDKVIRQADRVPDHVLDADRDADWIFAIFRPSPLTEKTPRIWMMQLL